MSYKCNCPGLGERDCVHPCNAGCCPGGTPAGKQIHQDQNPSGVNSFGFTKNYDGRIRGGIKTLGAFTNPTPVTASGYSQFTGYNSCYRLDAGGCIKCPSHECNKTNTPCKYFTPACKRTHINYPRKKFAGKTLRLLKNRKSNNPD
tara:strand:- start:363 stop:800 length:438 start_codon:yes stop_codon:yes gene_type:complete